MQKKEAVVSNQESAKQARTEWFEKDRFGLFIHWGLYSIPATGEWKRSYEELSIEDYQQYFDEFNPVDYNPKHWARLAKSAGMKYAILTVKHHEGFCLFDSKYTDYKSTNTLYKKDLVREFVDAFRAEGLKIGFYYSLFDWHHPDYPHYGDLYHPMRNNLEYKDYKFDFNRYLEYMHNQVRELLTNYGQVDIFWFDNSYADMRGEVWKSTELVKMMKTFQPEIIINNRLECNAADYGSLITNEPTVYCGDFIGPEQIVPPMGILDYKGDSVPWEACCTLNNNWGYVSNPNNYKSAKTIIRKLVECVSKNGKLLLNIGPDAKGRIPTQAENVLLDIADWMKDYEESIHGCGAAGLPKPDWGYYTACDDNIYLHLFEQNIGPIPFKIDEGRIKSIRDLADASELLLVKPWVVELFKEYSFFNFSSPPQATFPLRNQIDTVVKVNLISK